MGGYRAVSRAIAAVPVTIITTVFNSAPYLERTIDSVLAAGPGVEYIVIDGGSWDGTVNMLRRYDDQIAYWVSEPDRGIYDAMNKGWAAAQRGSRILYLGAGDELISLPSKLEGYAPNDIIFGRVYLGTVLLKAAADLRLRMGNTLHHQALLVPKSLSLTPPFDLVYRVYADFDFNQRLLHNGSRFVYADTFRARALPGGASSKLFVREALVVVRRNYGLGWSALAALYHTYQSVRRGFHDISLR